MNLINEIIANLTFIHLIILAMGSYSLTRLFVTDSFPLFEKPRIWIFDRFPPEDYARQGKPPRGEARHTSNNIYVVTKGHWLGELLSCPWCIGWWVSLIVFIAYVAAPELTLFALIPFALRAFVGGYANRIGGG